MIFYVLNCEDELTKKLSKRLHDMRICSGVTVSDLLSYGFTNHIKSRLYWCKRISDHWDVTFSITVKAYSLEIVEMAILDENFGQPYPCTPETYHVVMTIINRMVESGILYQKDTKEDLGMEETFGQRLKRLRAEAGYTKAKDFAQKMGLKYGSYLNYENQGTFPPQPILCKMADLLGVSVDELVGHKTPPDNTKRDLPKHGEVWRHFKDNLYQIEGLAYDSETKQRVVVYRKLYDDYSCWVRPLNMFMSEVDHVKYPDVKQKFRFELMSEGY